MIPPLDRRTGLLIPVTADALVGDFRRRHNAATVARRLPPHITVLFPFVPSSAVTSDLRAELAEHFATFDSFEAELTGVGSFDGYVWLAPEPRDRFHGMITGTCARFPDYPPYAGGGGEPEPHLTVAAIGEGRSLADVVDLARVELGTRLPFGFVVTGVSLFEELGDGTWSESERFPLG